MAKKNIRRYNATPVQLSNVGELLRRYTGLASLEGSDPSQLVEELETCLPTQLDEIAEVLELERHISPTKGKAIQRVLSLFSFVLNTELPESRYAPGIVYSPNNRKPSTKGDQSVTKPAIEKGGDVVTPKKAVPTATSKSSPKVEKPAKAEETTMHTQTHSSKKSIPEKDEALNAKIRMLQTECPYREGSSKAAFYELLKGITTVKGYVAAAQKKRHSEKDAVSALKRMSKFRVIKLV